MNDATKPAATRESLADLRQRHAKLTAQLHRRETEHRDAVLEHMTLLYKAVKDFADQHGIIVIESDRKNVSSIALGGTLTVDFAIEAPSPGQRADWIAVREIDGIDVTFDGGEQSTRLPNVAGLLGLIAGQLGL